MTRRSTATLRDLAFLGLYFLSLVGVGVVSVGGHGRAHGAHGQPSSAAPASATEDAAGDPRPVVADEPSLTDER